MSITKAGTYMPYLITKLSNRFGGESSILNWTHNVHKNLSYGSLQCMAGIIRYFSPGFRKGSPREAGKNKEMDSPLELPVGKQPCQYLDFSPVRPASDV